MTPTNRLPAIEALGEALAALEGKREMFRRQAAYAMCPGERYFMADAKRLQEHLANSGWTLTPGPTVNAGEEVA